MTANQVNDKRKVVLSSVWIFFLFNILYADVLMLMGSAGAKATEAASDAHTTLLSPEMLLGAAIILEVAFAMIILCRVAKHQINRLANIVVAVFQGAVLVASLFVATPAIYYIFFVSVEILALLFIVWYAWTWSEGPIVQQNIRV